MTVDRKGCRFSKKGLWKYHFPIYTCFELDLQQMPPPTDTPTAADMGDLLDAADPTTARTGGPSHRIRSGATDFKSVTTLTTSFTDATQTAEETSPTHTELVERPDPIAPDPPLIEQPARWQLSPPSQNGHCPCPFTAPTTRPHEVVCKSTANCLVNVSHIIHQHFDRHPNSWFDLHFAAWLENTGRWYCMECAKLFKGKCTALPHTPKGRHHKHTKDHYYEELRKFHEGFSQSDDVPHVEPPQAPPRFRPATLSPSIHHQTRCLYAPTIMNLSNSVAQCWSEVLLQELESVIEYKDSDSFARLFMLPKILLSPVPTDLKLETAQTPYTKSVIGRWAQSEVDKCARGAVGEKCGEKERRRAIGNREMKIR